MVTGEGGGFLSAERELCLAITDTEGEGTAAAGEFTPRRLSAESERFGEGLAGEFIPCLLAETEGEEGATMGLIFAERGS